METLKYLLQSKQSGNDLTSDVVSDSISWLSEQLKTAGIASFYADAGVGIGHYGYFQIKSLLKDTAITLHIKIAEINGAPYVAADVRIRGKNEAILFPYFGKIDDPESKLTLLHFIADFVLSTAPDPTTL